MPTSRILVVEDDGTVALMLSDNLRKLGYAVIDTVVTGEEAVCRAGTLRPDLVLMDIMLEGEMDGIEAAQEIRVRYDIPCVYMTAAADLDTIERMKATQPVGYLPKSTDPRTLYFTLETALNTHRVTRELRQSRQLLERTFASLHEAVFVLDSATTEILDCNPAATAIFGYARDEMLGRTTEFLHVDAAALDAFRAHLYPAVAETGSLYLPEFHMRRKDGVVFPTEHQVTPLEDDQGRRVGWVSAVRDVTARVAARDALQASVARYQELVEALPDVVLRFDAAGRHLFASQRVEAITGLSAESFIGKTHREMGFPEELCVFWEDSVRRVFESGQPHETEFAYEGARGRVTFNWRLGPEFDEVGAVRSVLSISRDVTAQRQAEAELRHQERLAAVGKLAGGIAHDFNNLLATIVLYDHLALNHRQTLPEGVVRALDTILVEANRASSLVQQILDFSRRAVLDVGPLDLVRFVRQVVRVLRPTLPESIHLRFETTCATCTVRADPTRIEQALINLAVNARDAMPDGGELCLSLSALTLAPDQVLTGVGLAAGTWACLEVRDTGVGMDAAVRQHLFEPFFTTKPTGKGTGLGLSQVYGIVKQHHGHIDVESAPGGGATFVIYLPVVADVPGDADAADGTAFRRGRGELLLLVEDQDNLRKATEQFLVSLGYRVVAARDGWEALELARQMRPALLLTDVVMPNMGGRELLPRLRETHTGLRAIAVTGYTLDQEISALHAAGFDATVTKPFNLQDFAATLRAILDRSS